MEAAGSSRSGCGLQLLHDTMHDTPARSGSGVSGEMVGVRIPKIEVELHNSMIKNHRVVSKLSKSQAPACCCLTPNQPSTLLFGERSEKAYSTWYSQAVSHPSTNQARPCLASEI